jgi:hypothetical protein
MKVNWIKLWISSIKQFNVEWQKKKKKKLKQKKWLKINKKI